MNGREEDGVAEWVAERRRCPDWELMPENLGLSVLTLVPALFGKELSQRWISAKTWPGKEHQMYVNPVGKLISTCNGISILDETTRKGLGEKDNDYM
jgi:hypothetical protein